MARKNRAGKLAGLAALGTLLYSASRKDKEADKKTDKKSDDSVDANAQGAVKPGDDVSKSVRAEDAPQSDVSYIQKPRSKPRPPPAATSASSSKNESASASGGARSTGVGGATADEMQLASVRGGARSTGVGGATADEMRSDYARREREQQMGRGTGRAPYSSGRSTGVGGATADEMRRFYDGSRAAGRGGPSADEMRRFYEAENDRRRAEERNPQVEVPTFRKGGAIKVKKMASGGMTSKVSSASKRADGIAVRGKTKCKMY